MVLDSTRVEVAGFEITPWFIIFCVCAVGIIVSVILVILFLSRKDKSEFMGTEEFAKPGRASKTKRTVRAANKIETRVGKPSQDTGGAVEQLGAEKTIYCIRCGRPLIPKSKFCTGCGMFLSHTNN